MLEKKYTSVNLGDVDLHDRTFCLNPDADGASLVHSIREAGLLYPPLLQEKGGGFRIIAGFKRMHALEALGIVTFDAFVISSTETDLDLFLLAARDRLSNGKLDAIELSLFIHKLHDGFGVARENIIKSYLPLAGYGRNPRVYELYARIHQLETEWREAVRREQTPVDLANDMLERAADERRVFFNLFQSLRLGKNRQREFVLLISDLARIAKTSIVQLFDSAPVRDILNDEKQTPSQKADRLKQWLWRERYPRFARASEAFEALLKDQKLPSGLSIQPPPWFEGERFSAAFSFSTQEEFQNYISALQRLLDDGVVKKIIDMP